MKKTASFFFLLSFLIVNSGIVISVHWCGGKLASIDFFSPEGHNCKCGKKAMKSNCCKDKILHFKANKEIRKSNPVSYKFISFPGVFALRGYPELFSFSSLTIFKTDFYHPPLFKPKVPIYVLDGVFII